MKRAAHRIAALALSAGAIVLVLAVGAQPSLQRGQAPPTPDSPVPSGATAPAPDPLFVAFRGDPQAGQRVVMGASGAGVASACFSCHGLQGEGDRGGAFPRLAAQPAYYLYKQLNSYADGTRPNDVMTPIAIKLSEAERRDVAAYYAAAQAGFRPPPGGDATALQLGGSIAAVGSPARGVQACIGCHGPGGSGLPPDTPYLAGLGAPYMELQLQLWAQGQRRNDPLGVMADVARRLTPEERRAVSLYFAALQPPGP